MPKYWGKQIFTQGDSPKWVKNRRRRRKKEEEQQVGEVNGPLRFRPPRVAHASCLDQCFNIYFTSL